MALTGRRCIYTDIDEVDASNVGKLITNTVPTHEANCADMRYLWNYFRGTQPILGRVKDVRPEICNNIVENHAQEVVSFKTGYQLSEPIQYICRSSDDGAEDANARSMTELNALMFAEDSDSKNRDLFEWECITGLGYKFAESARDDKAHGDVEFPSDGGAPFNFHIPEPWSCYVVYSSKYHRRPVAGVWITEDTAAKKTYCVYTPKRVFTVKGGKVVAENLNAIGMIPIIEYDLNNARMGVFEAALPILDAINNLASNRMDGVEQVVQALYLFKNCQIDREEFAEMLALGAVSVSSTDGMQGDVSLITNNIDQSQTQVMKDDLYQALLDICGMPSRNPGGANDTGSAVLLRDGWTLAESHAKSYELQFKKAEREFLRVVLRICDGAGKPVGLKLRDIDLAFNRRNYDNVLTKAQVLTTMLATGKVDPLDCFKSCGLFTDPSAAYLRSVAYIQEEERKAQELFERQQAVQIRAYDDRKKVDHDGDGFANEDNHGRREVLTGERV